MIVQWIFIFLCFLPLIILPLSLDPCYSTYSDISKKEIYGSWHKGSKYNNPAQLAHQKDPKVWWNHACPVQSRLFSCQRHDSSETSGHGHDSFNRRFVPANCLLRSFDAITFLQQLQDRRLAIAGDSVSMQFFTLLACSLHSVVKAEYNVSWFKLADVSHSWQCDGKAQHCHLNEATIYYPEYNTTLLLLSNYWPLVNLNELYQKGKLFSRHDILLMNNGFHRPSIPELSKRLQNISQEYYQRDPKKQPILIWRETSPQHFQSKLGDYDFSKIHLPCSPFINPTTSFEEDYYNRLADQWFAPFHRIPVMRIWNVSSVAWDQHVGKQHRMDNISINDCTHYCDNAAVLHYWREVLFNILPIIIQEREAKEEEKGA